MSDESMMSTRTGGDGRTRENDVQRMSAAAAANDGTSAAARGGRPAWDPSGGGPLT